MARRGLPRIAISMGDPSGIGPEVLCAALRKPRIRRALVPVVFGDASLAPKLKGIGAELVEVTSLPPSDRRPGRPTKAGGAAQLRYVQAAVAAAQEGLCDALCTAPVSKEQITRAGFPFRGHTELLAQAFGAEVLMLMDGPRLKVALATHHLPLAEVPRTLTSAKLTAQLLLLSRSLAIRLGRRPRLAVCGLNPHAGEGGLLGTEERTLIAPALAAARRAGVRCEGPFAADGLFAQVGTLPYDAVLAMYHDQGLVAAKALDFAHTVNVTLGLPVPRTSPDHGVAYALAGKGRADPTSMVQALLAAANIVRPRRLKPGRPSSIFAARHHPPRRTR
ncbi:MAG: 4-hydroxythreonine-4-phosphate dehydrogenase PdxA [Myxococcota bacterium]